MITISTARVYQVDGNGRRWLTPMAACKAEANAMAKKKYPCTCDEETGHICSNHGEEWIDYRNQQALILYTEFKNRKANP